MKIYLGDLALMVLCMDQNYLFTIDQRDKELKVGEKV